MRLTLREQLLAAMFAGVIAVSAQIVIPLGFIPLSLQTFTVGLTATLLGRRTGSWAITLYLLLGFIGLPVFAGGKSGIGVLFGPTGGYLIGYLFLVFFTGLFVEKFPNKIPMYFVGGIIGIIVCYAFGTVWFVLQYKVGFLEALTMCVFPYIPMDLVKLVAAVIIGSQVRKILIRQNLIS